MDANKLKILQDIEYRIHRSCGNCKYRNISGFIFGTCKKHKYSHLKHSASNRELSVCVDGICKYHEWMVDGTGDYYKMILDKFAQFMEK
jgi:hypothetical protein